MIVDQVKNLTEEAVVGGVRLSWQVEPTSYLDGFSFIVKEASTGKVLVSKRVMDPTLRTITLPNLPSVPLTCNVACEQRVGGSTVTATPLPIPVVTVPVNTARPVVTVATPVVVAPVNNVRPIVTVQ